MREQEMRARIARVIADIDAGRVRPVRGGPGRYLGSTVLVATMSLSGCAKDGAVDPTPPPDRADPLPTAVAEYAAVDADPVPAYANVILEPEPWASASASASTAPAVSTPPKSTAKPGSTTKDVAPTTRTIRHPPLPYMAPDP
jgi:hypothetical protein